METILAEVKKFLVLVFAHFRKDRMGALRKKLLEHSTAIFGILNYIIVEDSGKL